MSGQVCRIRWREGEPLGLHNYPPVGFLDLPREVRCQIYRYLVVAPEPIRVWNGTRRDTYKNFDVQSSYKMVEQSLHLGVKNSDPLLKALTLGLLYSCRKISSEAAAIFYQANAFAFGGTKGCDTWQPLCRFLSSIGERNRASLQELIVEVYKPEQLVRDQYGTHSSDDVPWQFRKIHYTGSSESQEEGPVEYISPAIEPCLALLGDNGAPVILLLLLEEHVLPGIDLLSTGDDELREKTMWRSLEVPELVEHSREEYAADRVRVMWHGFTNTTQLRSQRETIESKGWLIKKIERRCSKIKFWLVMDPHYRSNHKDDSEGSS